jgi:FkbH-like protein
MQRQRYYAEQRERIEISRKAATLEDFYRSLKQEIAIEEVTPESAERIAQLTQKTNQFNLTTRRYSKQQIMSLASRSGWNIFGVWVKDRFGDSGLSGVAITHYSGEICGIDTFLLSCRVIGRTVETALLSFLVKRAQSLGLRQLQGRFVPTKKNTVASDFYRSHNFQLIAEEVGGGGLWSVALEAANLACPEWIQLTAKEPRING